MTAGDLPSVETIGLAVHPDLPEDPTVFAERLVLYPAGCLVLQDGDQITGYAIGHPWRLGQPPKLDSLLARLPQAPDTFYIHDLALLEGTRGTGAGGDLVRRLLKLAQSERLTNLSLVAVSGSAGFWLRQGFKAVDDASLAASLRSYGEAASFMVRTI